MANYNSKTRIIGTGQETALYPKLSVFFPFIAVADLAAFKKEKKIPN